MLLQPFSQLCIAVSSIPIDLSKHLKTMAKEKTWNLRAKLTPESQKIFVLVQAREILKENNMKQDETIDFILKDYWNLTKKQK